MSIAILYEYPGTDELGIQCTAQMLGVDLTFIPSRKISFLLGKNELKVKNTSWDYSEKIKDISVVLNRSQSKNRRLFIVDIFEAMGKKVINPSQVEHRCSSKLRTLLHFWREGVRIPQTIYVPCDPTENTKDGRKICNENYIVALIQRQLCGKPLVLKPDAGSHGKNIKLAKGEEQLLKVLGEITPSVINPLGVLAQELVQKWFFDLRIIVAKEGGRKAFCYPKAMARAGLDDFRTNAYLGNMVFGIDLPESIMDKALKCAESIAKSCEAWIIALDAMIDFGEEIPIDGQIVSNFEKLVPLFSEIQKIKSQKVKRENFYVWNEKLERAFQTYASSEAYNNIKGIIEESIRDMENHVVFHEANSCPDFWEQTRLAAGIDVAKQLLLCAQSLIDKEVCVSC